VKLFKLTYIIVVLLLSLVVLGKPVITQETNQNFDWKKPSFDNHSTSFNPQTALNKDNVATLTQNWMTTLGQQSILLENVTVKTASNPLLSNGILYVLDRTQVLLAIRVDDNSEVWSQQLSVPNPQKYSVINERVDARYISYFEDTVWVIDLDCSINGYNGYNGDLKIVIPPQVLCGNTSPESKPRNVATRVISAPIFYQKDRIIIASTSGLESADHSLSYVVGISLDTRDIVWKTSLIAGAGENIALGWGDWSIDQEEDIVYIGTGSPIPEWDATHRNGANTYSNSIIALKASTGEIIWKYQTNPYDINGYGCTGNIILGEIAGKKTVYSACKNGYLYALDAKTGDIVWYFDPPNVKRLNSENANFVKTNTYDPNKHWINYPSTDTIVQCPGVFGAVSFNIALGYDTIYMSTFNRCSELNVAPVEKIGDTGVVDINQLYENAGPMNSTLYAIDASTGDVKWSQFFDGIDLKGGITVSGGLIYQPAPDGYLHIFNAETGSPVLTKNFGTLGLFYSPIIGADSFGNWTLVQVVAGTPLLHSLGQYSGYLFALSPDPSTVSSIIIGSSTNLYNYNLIVIYSAIAIAIILLVGITLYYIRRRS